tara:strand:- start:41260 stop:42474 length:1215 start_codon:yes stop_codon:yes gene_type:complete
MGFNNITSSINLVAKLTPFGRQRLVSTNNALITTFSLGDSDANYNTQYALTSGQVPALGGDIGPNNSFSNSVTTGVSIKSMLFVNGNGLTKKNVEAQSTNIISETKYNGLISVSGNSVNMFSVDRNSFNTNSLVNLYYSFGLPITASDDVLYSAVTYTYGGYSDTAYSALSTTKIVVLGIKNETYGEMIDGKTIKLVLPTTGGTYTIYSTFQNKNSALTLEDSSVNDSSVNSNSIDSNIAFLFSDTIKKPNGDSSLSWSTGWNSHKPFSLNNKSLFNFQTNSNLNLTADTLVGVAYLDKGILVLTNPIIVDKFINSYSLTGVTTGTTISFDSISTEIYQNITCLANRGEFGSSMNPTLASGINPRISEVGLYDNEGHLIAIAKTDRHIIKNVNEFLALGIKINL